MTSFDISTPFRLSAAILGVLVAYYLVPFDVSGSAEVLNLMLTAIAVAGLIYIVRVQWLTHLDDSTGRGTYGALTLLLIIVVVMFALGYYVLETNRPDQFVGLETRTDALYFTMTTLTTTGFGDIHAAAQLARILVSAQMLFDLAFLAAVGAAVSNRLRHNVAHRTIE